ncbi:MAG: hypothetical protein WC924_03630 [Candidatus Gracilibacteria bacterium]
MNVKDGIQWCFSEAWYYLKGFAQLALFFFVLWFIASMLDAVLERWTTYEGRTAEEWAMRYDEAWGCVEYSDDGEDAEDCF